MLTEATTEDVLAYLEDRTVAVVANSPCILERKDGVEIDSHDIVIRINRALPRDHPEKTQSIGLVTDVLAGGNFGNLADLETERGSPEWLWWFKVTKHGERKKQGFLQWGKTIGKPMRLWQWPMTWENVVHETMGCPGTTGARILYLLAEHAKPKAVDVYGMTIWSDCPTSWYSNKTLHPSHDAAKERDWMEQMPYCSLGDGRWQMI